MASRRISLLIYPFHLFIISSSRLILPSYGVSTGVLGYEHRAFFSHCLSTCMALTLPSSHATSHDLLDGVSRSLVFCMPPRSSDRHHVFFFRGFLCLFFPCVIRIPRHFFQAATSFFFFFFCLHWCLVGTATLDGDGVGLGLMSMSPLGMRLVVSRD